MKNSTLARHARRIAITLAPALTLAGCGAEVAGSAATVGALQAQQAERVRAQQKQIVNELDKTLKAAAAATASAADQQ